MRPHRSLAIAALLLPLAAGAVRAGSETGSLGITANVIVACKLGAAALDFGTYTGGQKDELKAQGSIAYENCPAGQLRFGLDGGTSKDTKARTLVNSAGAKLKYQLYRNSTRTQIWGTGLDAHTATLATAGSGNVPVYGSIVAAQSVPAGSYSDTVVITMDF